MVHDAPFEIAVDPCAATMFAPPGADVNVLDLRPTRRCATTRACRFTE